MRLHLGGHLNWYDPQKRHWIELSLPETTRLRELVSRLGVPPGEVALVVVNGRLIALEEARIVDGDRVELYPPIGGGGLSAIPTPGAFRSSCEGGVECLESLRNFVRQTTLELGAGPEDMAACELATDEAASNAFEHAYAGGTGRIEVIVWREGNDVIITVRNWGTAFDPTSVPEPDPSIPIEDRPIGGLGLFLMRKLMDQVSFTFDPDEGNTVTLRRKLGRGAIGAVSQ